MKAVRGVDGTDLRKEEKIFRCALLTWFDLEYGKEVHEKIQRHL